MLKCIFISTALFWSNESEIIYSLFSFYTYCFVLEELGELVTGLISMCITLPVIRHVMDMSQDNPQQLLWTKYHIRIRNK